MNTIRKTSEIFGYIDYNRPELGERTSGFSLEDYNKAIDQAFLESIKLCCEVSDCLKGEARKAREDSRFEFNQIPV